MSIFPLKTCFTCWSDQPLSNFQSQRSATDGLCAYCKLCKYQAAKVNKLRKTHGKDWHTLAKTVCIRSCIVNNDQILRDITTNSPEIKVYRKALKVLGFSPKDPDKYQLESYIEDNILNVFLYKNEEISKIFKYDLSQMEPEDIAFELGVLFRGMKVRLERNEETMHQSKVEIYPYTKVEPKTTKKIAFIAINHKILSNYENKARNENGDLILNEDQVNDE